MRRFVLVLLPLISCAAFAQQASTGSVSGHVTCGDTQRPARFATVTLYDVPTDTGAATPDPNNVKDFSSAMSTLMGQASMAQGQTALDGSFTVGNLTPGDYYIFATQAGYETPRSTVQQAIDAGADLKKPLPGIPLVHVNAGRQSNADVSMTRGAALSGTVSWDDGTPVSGVHVMVQPAAGDGKKLPPQFAMVVSMGSMGVANSIVATTDDLGHFRLSGLSPGAYIVQASESIGGGIAVQHGKFDMTSAMHTSPLVVYAPGAFHKGDARPVTLTSGEDHGDVAITFNLNGTHTVSGHVEAVDDHQAVNAGKVALTDANDKEFIRSGSLDNEGNFTVEFVPPGTYNLTVTGAAIKEAAAKPSRGMFSSMHTVQSFDDGKASLVVSDSDVTGQNMQLTASKKTTQDPDMNAILGGVVGSADPPPPPSR